MRKLEAFGDEIWIAAGADVTSAGFAYPTRMAVIRLDDGGLFVWSPVALTPDLRASVDALGVVRFIVTPTAMHHLALPAWRTAYPKAVLYAASESRKRSPHIAFDAVLSEAAEAGWAGQIDQAPMRGNAIATEVVFFHRKSGTVLFADLLQNFPPGWFKGWRASIAAWDDMIGATPKTPRKFRLAFTNRKAARASVARVLSWPARQVLMAHGTPVREDGAVFLADAFRWL